MKTYDGKIHVKCKIKTNPTKKTVPPLKFSDLSRSLMTTANRRRPALIERKYKEINTTG